MADWSPSWFLKVEASKQTTRRWIVSFWGFININEEDCLHESSSQSKSKLEQEVNIVHV